MARGYSLRYTRLQARQTVLTSADVDAAGAEAVEEARREMNEIKLATDAATMSVYLKVT